MANSPEYITAMANQGRTIRQLIQAGYTKDNAIRLAKLWYPTPAQARMRKAREGKKVGNGV